MDRDLRDALIVVSIGAVAAVVVGLLWYLAMRVTP